MLLDFSGAPHGGKIKLLPEAFSQSTITPVGVVDHTIVGSGEQGFAFFKDSSGNEATFINNLDGELWELMPLDRVADARVAGNSFVLDGKRCGLLSIEHADNGDPDHFGFTEAQLESDIWLHNRLAEIFDWPRRKITEPTGNGARGLGYHSMWLGTPFERPDGTTPWTDTAGKTCPGRPARVTQWNEILLPAFLRGGGGDWFDMATEKDLKDAIREVFHLPESGLAVPPGQPHNGNLGVKLLGVVQDEANTLNALQSAIEAVRRDVNLQGDDEAKIIAKLNEVESMLPRP